METLNPVAKNDQSVAVSTADVAEFLNRFRQIVGLQPKEAYASNFYFDSPVLECVHVLRIEFDDIYAELEAEQAAKGLKMPLQRIPAEEGRGLLAHV